MTAHDGSGDDMDESAPVPADLDADTAERMVSGQIDAADAPPGFEGVVEVLRAAAAPATEAELLGEDDAVSMFRAQWAEPSNEPAVAPVVSLESQRARRVSRRALVVGAVAGVILASSGVAAAAGGLPDPVQRVAHDTLSRIGVSVPEPPPRPPAPRPADDQPRTSTTKTTPPSTEPPARREQPSSPPSTRAPEPTPPASTPPSTSPAPTSAPPSTSPAPPPPPSASGSISPNAAPPTPTVRQRPSGPGVDPAPTGP